MTYAEYQENNRDPRTQEAVDSCQELNRQTRMNEIKEAGRLYSEYKITERAYEKLVKHINDKYRNWS